MTSILNVLGFSKTREEREDDLESEYSANNGTSALLLPFETKASAIRENVETISGILDKIPTSEFEDGEQDVHTEQHMRSLLQVETKLQSMLKEILKLQKQNNRFAKTHWREYPGMVRMQNTRFADVVQHVRRITDKTSDVHTKYQSTLKLMLHKQCALGYPDAKDDEIKAFVEGWRNGERNITNDKMLRAKRNKIQNMSGKLTQLYDIMHDLSEVLSEHEQMAENIGRKIEEASLNTDSNSSVDADGNIIEEETESMRQISKQTKMAFGLTFAAVALWFMLRQLGVFTFPQISVDTQDTLVE